MQFLSPLDSSISIPDTCPSSILTLEAYYPRWMSFTLCVSHKYVVVETWLSACVLDQELLIPGYSLAHKDRNRYSDGVAIFVTAYIPFKLLHFSHQEFELILLEFLLNSQLFTIGGLYRPPGAPADMSKLYTTLATLPPQTLSTWFFVAILI